MFSQKVKAEGVLGQVVIYLLERFDEDYQEYSMLQRKKKRLDLKLERFQNK